MSEHRAVQPRIEELGEREYGQVQDFLRAVPRGEFVFLKDDIDDPVVLDTWHKRNGAQIFLAYLEDDLAGLLALIPGIGWSRHVGEFRMVVDPAKRGRGVGAALARRSLDAALATSLKKVSVEVLAEQEAVAALFRDLAFTPEALLADQVRDDSGHLHDLLVLSHPVDEAWSTLATIGMVHDGVQT